MKGLGTHSTQRHGQHLSTCRTWALPSAMAIIDLAQDESREGPLRCRQEATGKRHRRLNFFMAFLDIGFDEGSKGYARLT